MIDRLSPAIPVFQRAVPAVRFAEFPSQHIRRSDMAVEGRAQEDGTVVKSNYDNDLRQCRRVHLVGISGSGMSCLASVLSGWGWTVSGSDLNLEPAAPLAQRGVRLSLGHHASFLPDEAQALVYSDAVPRNNPELLRAVQRGLPILSYFQALGQFSRAGQTVAVAGTHGKSTTTAMLGHLLTQAGQDPTVFCGAAPLDGGFPGRAGTQDLVVAEACEYRENFLHLAPKAAVVLNIEDDHFDFYRYPGQLDLAFTSFVQKIPADGLLVVRHECPRARKAAQAAECRVETFGLDPDADWSAAGATHREGRYAFEILRAKASWAKVRLSVPGHHNVLNALAAAALGAWRGLSADQVGTGLASFSGLRRRLEHVGLWRGADWVDDFAHHPTEVTAALAAVRDLYPNRRVWTVFQPHQASRTAELLDEFAASLENSDRLFIAEIFRAREGRVQPGEVTAADLAERLRVRGVRVPPVHRLAAIAQWLEGRVQPGDVVLTLGAGDVRRLGRDWIDSLSRDGTDHELDFRFREDRAAG